MCNYTLFISPPLIAAADWMTSPMVFVFCTPDVKTSPRTNSTISSRSPGTNELPPPSQTETPRCPDFETRWLVKETKVVNSNYEHLHTRFTMSSFSLQCYFFLHHCEKSL